jgi:hypothetical protein
MMFVMDNLFFNTQWSSQGVKNETNTSLSYTLAIQRLFDKNVTYAFDNVKRS